MSRETRTPSTHSAPRTRRFLEDPDPRPRHYTVVSVDDHIVEPPDTFAGRVPRKFEDRAPKVITTKSGKQVWLYEDSVYPNVGLNAIAGYPKEEWGTEPARFDEMRPGCYDIHARVADMDIAGIYASANFPSLITGFGGTVFSMSSDKELGLAVMRAYNDWHIDVWASPYPERIIPVQITWLADAEIAAEEIRRNAARGFKAVAFTENPVNQGQPSLYSGYWDPFLRACEETETVICLHVGSGTMLTPSSPDAPFEVPVTLFPMSALSAATEWLWSGVPTRFPNIKICLSEGGVSWVPMFLERIDYTFERHNAWTHTWDDPGHRPSEIFKRNFWVCSLYDPTGIEHRHEIGVENITVESDYPHGDSNWPDIQPLLKKEIGHLPSDEIRMITWENASKLFRHPVPTEVVTNVQTGDS